MAKKKTENEIKELWKFIEFYIKLSIESSRACIPGITEERLCKFEEKLTISFSYDFELLNEGKYRSVYEICKDRINDIKQLYDKRSIYFWEKLIEYDCPLFPNLSRPALEEYLISILEKKKLDIHYFRFSVCLVEEQIKRGDYPIEEERRERILELLDQVKDWYLHTPKNLWSRLRTDYKLSDKEADIKVKEILKERKKNPQYKLDYSNHYCSVGGL